MNSHGLTLELNDGGRKAAGFRGIVGDCVTRSVAIATGMPYREVYDAINELAKEEQFRRGKIGRMHATGRGSSAREGVFKDTWKAYLRSLGFVWTPTMTFGKGCTVHVRAAELPLGRHILQLSKHLTVVSIYESNSYGKYGIIRDTHDPSRNGTRCVYGYYTLTPR